MMCLSAIPLSAMKMIATQIQNTAPQNENVSIAFQYEYVSLEIPTENARSFLISRYVEKKKVPKEKEIVEKTLNVPSPISSVYVSGYSLISRLPGFEMNALS
jgi:hypothetical protein